jgi:hypothetical protein
MTQMDNGTTRRLRSQAGVVTARRDPPGMHKSVAKSNPKLRPMRTLRRQRYALAARTT